MVARAGLVALVALAAVVWAADLIRHGWSITGSFFSPISLVVTVLAGVLVAFDQTAWSWPGVRSLAKRKDLRGTWRGTIASNWARPETGTGIAPIEAYLVVRQTFSTLHLRLLTVEAQSMTLVATLVAETDGTCMVAAIYRGEPRLAVRDRSAIHHGGMLLRVDAAGRSLAGSYWTDRRTHGELEFHFLSRELAGDFEGARLMA